MSGRHAAQATIQRSKTQMTKSFTLLALIVLLVAAFLRISALSTYPPGPHFDEAANILITRSIAFDGANLFPLANSYQGRESLYFYLNVPVFQLIGDDVFALRLTSMWINLLTIAAAMRLGRAMFGGQRGWVIGIAIGVMMAISFHQIFMSRQAYRAVTLPMMQALGLLFLWRGLTSKRRDWLWLLLGGVFAGGGIYTYMASRLFPLWLGIGGLALLWFDRARWQHRLRQGVIFFGAMLITMLPMLIYALDNPDIFFQRLDEVTDGEVTVTLADSIRLHAEMFFIRGDSGNLRYNDPGRPYFTLIEGGLLLIGLAVAAWRMISPKIASTQRTAYVLALLAPLMVIPSVISVAGFPPSHMRSLGMVPLIFVLVAIGAEAVLKGISTRQPQIKRAIPALVIAVLVLGAVLVRGDYMQWAARADLFYQADGDLAAAADWLDERVAADTQVYVASFHREHPTWITAWEQPVTWLGGDSLFLPPPGEEAVAIFARNAPPNDGWRPLIETGLMADIPGGPDGNPAFWAYRLTSDMAPPTDATTLQNPLLALLDAQVNAVVSGETGAVVMVWQVQQQSPYYRLRPLINLLDANGTTIFSTDVFLLGTNSWRPGETMIQEVPLRVPHGTPPGTYTVTVAWVDRDTDTFINYTDPANSGSIQAEIATVEVTRPSSFPESDVLPIIQPFDEIMLPGMHLLGWNPVPISARPGETLRPVLFWQATPTDGQRSADEVEIALVSGSDERIPLPTFDYAPSNWVDGELIIDRPLWLLPRDLAAGPYQLMVNDISLAEIEIADVGRVFDAPTVDVATGYQFGDAISLHGYTLNTDATIDIELIWQAQAVLPTDYKVFVHLLDEAGEIIAQHDVMPRNWTYPTSLWAAGEYISDPYGFDATEAAHAIRFGFYAQDTGTRLPIILNGASLENNFVTITLKS